MIRLGPRSSLPPGTVSEFGDYAVGNNGEPFAVSRKCRHLGANLAEGSISPEGCLVCPWHQSEYDVTTGRMVKGPQGVFAKIPGLGLAFTSLTRVLPLKVARVTEKDGELYLDD
jgi:nitrite reductase/ring-hydroxylating ferredoxin subunit